MFCDLVGSTALSTSLDPEDLREVIATYHARVAEVAGQHSGFVAKYMGDGVLVYFGYPQAHEDDPERAVQAGLDIINAIGQLALPTQPLQVRVGIATGLVVVGDLIGSGASAEQAVVGGTPNLAARLQTSAAPNTVMIDETTHRLTGRLFDYADVGPIKAKGFDKPIPAWRVTGPALIESLRIAAGATATSMPIWMLKLYSRSMSLKPGCDTDKFV
jgi:class 3 adenylate cyclase